MTADSTNVMQNAYFLSLLRFSFVTIPMADKAAITVGNSNTIPNVSIIDMNNDIYEEREKVFGTSGLT